MSTEQITQMLNEAWHNSGMTQAQLAEKSGIPLTTLNNYLNGKVAHPAQEVVDSIMDTVRATPTEPEAPTLTDVQLHALERRIAQLQRDITMMSAQTKAEHEQLLEIGAKMIRKEFVEKTCIFFGFIIVSIFLIVQFH